MPNGTERANPLHASIAQLEQEMADVLSRCDIPPETQRKLEQRLRDLKAKAGVDSESAE